MTTLRGPPYNLAFATTVFAKFAAHNARGWSTVSGPSILAVVKIETEPQAMTTPTALTAGWTNTQLQVDWTAQVSPFNGDSTILSYNLEWD